MSRHRRVDQDNHPNDNNATIYRTGDHRLLSPAYGSTTTTLGCC